MKFRFRTHHDRNLFGLAEPRTDWNLLDTQVDQIESVTLGPTCQAVSWSNLGVAVKLGRWRTALGIMLIAFGLLASRSAYLQVVDGEHYRQIAEANRTRLQITPAHRGIIKDRHGFELAKNSPNFRLLAQPGDIPGWPDSDIAINSLANQLELPASSLVAKLVAAKPDEQTLLTDGISYEHALSFFAKSHNYPGFTVELAETRQYYTNAVPSLSHVLGYTGPVSQEDFTALADKGYRRFDHLGKLGLEAWYETSLRGQFGKSVIEVDSLGNTLRVVSEREAVDGQDIILALDTKLQAYIETALEDRLRQAPTQRAAVVVMNPINGEILALVSVPGFDANLFTNGISHEAYATLLADPNTPLFPRAQAGEYPAGSTIKPVFASAALGDGIITPQTTFFSSGGVMLGNRFFPDWRAGGHGLTDVYHAIADSVNTFFYLIGGGNESFPGLGLEKLMTSALAFGFGQQTGVDLPGETSGFLPSKAWKESAKGEPWYIGDTYNVSIGQGDLLVTPLQITRATAVFANGGELVTPHLVLGDEQPTTRILSPEIAGVVRDGMRQTVTAGSASSLQTVPVSVAGKTGTAQWSSSQAPHSWFTGFAPFDQPKIVITVLVEQGGDESLALPITRDILNWYFANQD